MSNTSNDIRELIASIKRDLTERIKLLEEYIELIDTDISRLRIELQKLSNKIDEALSKTATPQLTPLTPPPAIPKEAKPIAKAKPKAAKTTREKAQEGLSQTEIQILKYLAENPGTRSATPIASAIGKAREHVARTLKKLSDLGYVVRDESTWPYTYMLSEEAKKILAAHLT
ncbi:MAG: hypothetical protein DRJ31_06055 [Candidatus Methanomethylicota archaeon]|uniref:Transcription regulator TrmB N-terminal domain-containing protein n=1 Tax=Thermoproteota archaeon TaxID=2056631 RepID=A0A497F074_9CREN|nr:MAG: hypothetical protein DRJ31_06055 [Candidatus Verstraetearchaeota archaeon]RLE52719.1 MAG: hypothetical protein DRJ33_03005 [Candidatus Verstraetearchaeota archaeon]